MFSDLVNEVISVTVALLSLLGLSLAAVNPGTRWPLRSSVLKLGIYGLLVVLNIGLGFMFATVLNTVNLTGWAWMAWKRRIPKE